MLRYLFTITLIFSFLTLNVNSAEQKSFLPSIGETIHSIPGPLQLIKKTTKLLGRNILFGAATAALVVTGLENNDTYDTKTKKFKVENQIKKISALGRIYIDNLSEDVARRRALEDALYMASLKGGASVDGFSSINSGTELTESVLVRPVTRIIDYNIISSKVKGEHYEVEIEAIIGNLDTPKSACYKRENVHLTEYKLKGSINTNIPPWMDEIPKLISDEISSNLLSSNRIDLRKLDSKSFRPNDFTKDLSYDYASLTESDFRINAGDFAYVPSVKIYKTLYEPEWRVGDKNLNSQNPALIDTNSLKLLIRLEVYTSDSYKLAFTVDEEYLVPLSIDSGFESIRLLTRASRNSIREQVIKISRNLAEEIEKNILCQPLNAEINIVNKEILVPIGEKQGVKKNQLAVLDTKDTNDWVVLQVLETNYDTSILKPLNSEIEIASLIGMTAQFLE